MAYGVAQAPCQDFLLSVQTLVSVSGFPVRGGLAFPVQLLENEKLHGSAHPVLESNSAPHTVTEKL